MQAEPGVAATAGPGIARLLSLCRTLLARRALLFQGSAVDDDGELRCSGTIGVGRTRRIDAAQRVRASTIDRVERIGDGERVAQPVSASAGDACEGKTEDPNEDGAEDE